MWSQLEELRNLQAKLDIYSEIGYIGFLILYLAAFVSSSVKILICPEDNFPRIHGTSV